MSDSITRDMRPQPYPLACTTETFGRYLIIGWSSTDRPVAVPDGKFSTAKGDGPRVLAEEIDEYYIPEPTQPSA